MWFGAKNCNFDPIFACFLSNLKNNAKNGFLGPKLVNNKIVGPNRCKKLWYIWDFMIFIFHRPSCRQSWISGWKHVRKNWTQFFFVSLDPYEEIKTKIKVVPKKSRQPLYFEIAALTSLQGNIILQISIIM